MKNMRWFLLGAVTVIVIMVFMGATPVTYSDSNEVGRFQAVPMVSGSAGVFIIDTKTGVTKVVWGAWKGGQLGKSFSEMTAAPR